MRWIKAMLVALAVTLGGCAATVQRGASEAPLAIDPAARKSLAVMMTGSPVVLKSEDWEALKGAWRGALNTHAAAAGVTVRYVDARPAPGAAPETLVTLFVNDYRYISTGARFGLGIMTGNAYIDARARFEDLRSGRLVGERSFNTTSSAWQGVFSAMTDKQLDAISRELIADTQGR